MKKQLIVFIVFSTTLYGCFFDLGFDYNYRVDAPVAVSNLKDTLNIGDTLVFSATIGNPVKVTDISKKKRNVFEATLPDRAGFTILLYQLSEANVGSIRGVIPFEERVSIFAFFAEEGSFSRVPSSMVFDSNSGKIKIKIIPLKKGLYAVRIIQESITIKGSDNKNLTALIYPYFANKELNHKLLTENKASGPLNDGWVVFYVR